MPSVDTTQIPPQAVQALQQSGVQGGDITSILAQLAQMSPDEVSAALAQLGVQIDPDTLAQAASDWVDKAADNSSGTTPSDTGDAAAAEDGEVAAPAQPSSAPATEDMSEDQEGTGEGGGEGGGDDVQAAPQSRAMASRSVPSGGPIPPTGGANMARMTGGMPDELISAMLAQQATGNANSAIPMPRGGAGSIPGPQMRAPTIAPRNATAPGGDQAMKQMIGSIYRDLAATNRTGVPTGPRTGNPSTNVNPTKPRRRKGDA